MLLHCVLIPCLSTNHTVMLHNKIQKRWLSCRLLNWGNWHSTGPCAVHCNLNSGGHIMQSLIREVVHMGRDLHGVYYRDIRKIQISLSHEQGKSSRKVSDIPSLPSHGTKIFKVHCHHSQGYHISENPEAKQAKARYSSRVSARALKKHSASALLLERI